MKTPLKGLNQALLVIPTQKTEQMQEEIKQQLYKVPQEEELSQEYEELQKAKDLNEKWQQIKKEEEFQQAMITKKKLQKIEEDQKRLASRLEELINNPQMDEQEEKYKLIALKRRIEQDYKDDVQKLQEQFMISKEHEIERIVRKKIEMEKLIEKKKEANDKLLKLQLELEAIQEVKDKKDLNSKKLLNNALNRNGIPTNYISERDKQLLSDALLDDRVENERQKEQILVEVQQRINQQINEVDMETQERIRQLNDKKAELIDRQEKILREKAIHREMAAKGNDYMVQVEMGLAPKYEYLKLNQPVDEEVLDQYRSDLNSLQIADKNKRFLKEGPSKISQIQREQIMTYKDQPYQDELKPFLRTRNAESLFVARKIIDYIIDNAMRKVLEKENRIAFIKNAKIDYEARTENMKLQQQYLIDKEFVQLVATDIFQRVKKRVAIEAVNEIYKVNALAQSTALNIVIYSVKQERNTKNTQIRIKEIFEGLRGDNYQKLKKDEKFNFLDQNSIKWGNVKKGKKNYNREALLQELRKKRGQEQKQEAKVKQKEDDGEIEGDVQMLDLEIEQCTISQGLEQYKDIEMMYWQQIQFKPTAFKNHSQNLKQSVSHLSLSPFKDLLLVGMSTGEIQIYDTQASPSVQFGIVPTFNNQPIIDIQYGMDNVGHLLILDQSGNTRFCYNAYNLKVNIPKDQLKQIEQLPNIYQFMFYVQYFSMDIKYFERTKFATGDTKITFNIFTPAITFSCLQPYIFLGTDQGTIMKYNSNMNLYDGKHYKFAIHEVLNSRIIVNEDEAFPTANFLQLVDQGDQFNRGAHVYREFFKGHKVQIIHIGFIEQPEHIITIDRDGYIYYWLYENSYYQLRERSFRPKLKFKLELKTIKYVPDGEVKKFFPEKTTKNIQVEGREKLLADYDFEEQDPELQLIKFYQKDIGADDQEILLCKPDELPGEGETGIFEKIKINKNDYYLIEGYTLEYKAVAYQGYVIKAKPTMCGKFIYMAVIKPEKIIPDQYMLEFIGFNTLTFKLKKLYIQIQTSQKDNIEFDIVDNYYPFNISYLFVFLYNGIYVYSLSTGILVKQFVDYASFVKVTYPMTKKGWLPQGIQVIENECIFFSLQGSNGVWRLNVDDQNEEADQLGIDSYHKLEFEKLFIL